MESVVRHRPTVSGDLVFAHIQDVAALAVRLGVAVGVPLALLGALKTGALLHDIGKIGVPTPLLDKPGPLAKSQFAIVRRHVILGDKLARACNLPEPVRLIIRHHHERWDGAGYPDGLRGEKIPLLARIVAIADAYDAIVSDRPYRRAQSIKYATTELLSGAGTQFDPYLVNAFITQVLRRR